MLVMIPYIVSSGDLVPFIILAIVCFVGALVGCYLMRRT